MTVPIYFKATQEILMKNVNGITALRDLCNQHKKWGTCWIESNAPATLQANASVFLQRWERP